MNNLTVRIVVATAAALLIYLGATVIGAGMKPPQIVLPERDITGLPLTLGTWQGEKATLDPKIFMHLDAEKVTDRNYHDAARHSVSAHVAVFTEYLLGINHSPLQCYRVNGWTLLHSSKLQLDVGAEQPISVSVTSWELHQERVLVVYWYQLGDDVVLDRIDLAAARWNLKGRETWPAMIKVLLQTPIDNEQDAKARVQSLAEQIYRWINAPEAAGAAKPAESPEGGERARPAANRDERKNNLSKSHAAAVLPWRAWMGSRIGSQQKSYLRA